MELTMLVPDEIGQRVRQLSDPDRFVTRALLRALREDPVHAGGQAEQPSQTAEEPVTEGPLVERDGLLLVSAQLEDPFVDHRQIRDEYLDRVMGSAG